MVLLTMLTGSHLAGSAGRDLALSERYRACWVSQDQPGQPDGRTRAETWRCRNAIGHSRSHRFGGNRITLPWNAVLSASLISYSQKHFEFLILSKNLRFMSDSRSVPPFLRPYRQFFIDVKAQVPIHSAFFLLRPPNLLSKV